MDQDFPTAKYADLVRDIGEEAAKLVGVIDITGIEEDDLCVISPENGNYFPLSINGLVKRLPTGVKLHLSEVEKDVLRNANMLREKE
jgi:hypothetical protein